MKKESGARFPITLDTNVDILRTIVVLYCQWRVQKGTLTKMPRPKLINMITMYMVLGYNAEAKENLKKFFKETDLTNINSWNRELRAQGFLSLDPYNQNISHLSADLKSIKEKYYDKALEKGDVRVIFELKKKE